MRWLLLGLVGCMPEEPGTCDPQGSHLLVATTDYTVGVLAAVDPSAECLSDRLATLSPDPLVRTHEDQRYAVSRSAGDAVRSWMGVNWGEPLWEVGLDDVPNVHDVVWLDDDRLLVLPYDLPQLWVLDARTGQQLDAIDIADEDPSDGLPEPDSAVVIGDRIAVALQRFDRANAWAAQAGRVLWLDLNDLSVLDRVDTGPSPRVVAGSDGEVVVLTGAYGVLDGALHLLDPEEGLDSSILNEADWGMDFGAHAEVDGALVVVGTDWETGEASRALCVNAATGSVVAGDWVTQWYADVVEGDGRAWVAARRTWSGQGQGAIVELDPVTCEEAPRRYLSELEPYSLAWAGAEASP